MVTLLILIELLADVQFFCEHPDKKTPPQQAEGVFLAA
jgi:hypothetical protein